LVIKALDPDWIRIGIQPKMLDPDPDEMNADPQPCLHQYILFATQILYLSGRVITYILVTAGAGVHEGGVAAARLSVHVRAVRQQ
jgi:hypothetical protein